MFNNITGSTIHSLCKEKIIHKLGLSPALVLKDLETPRGFSTAQKHQ